MALLKSLWSFAVGVKDFLVLVLLLLVFGALWAGLSKGVAKPEVPDGGALYLGLDGVLVDEPTEIAGLAALTSGPGMAEIETRQLVRAIDAAAKDKAISVIVLDLDRFVGGGLANLEAVGAALQRAKAAGKPVEAYATAYFDDSYYLAAHASRVSMSPMGSVIIAGPGGNGLYFKDALDKLKVTVEVFRVGTYKSFVEPFTRNEASPEAREADQLLVDQLWAAWRRGVEAQRPKLDMKAIAESWPARVAGANQDQAKMSLDAGLVDAIASRQEFAKAIIAKAGADEETKVPGSYRGVDWETYLTARDPGPKDGPAVAIVHVSGSIVDGEAPAGANAGGDSVAALIDGAIADEEVKAIVLRVDSGGGSALASEVIRNATLDARAAGKPVVASFGPVAASGGYWVATGADAIFAQPTTITGSIGVFGILPTFERTLDDLGVSADGVVTTPLSGQPDLVNGLNQPTRQLLQGSVQDIYRRFLSLVADARKLPVEEVAKVAEGRVWSGEDALRFKLVDAHGGLEVAIADAAKRAKIEGEPRVVVMRKDPPMFAQLLSQLGNEVQGKTATPNDAMGRLTLASRARAVAQVEGAIGVAAGPSVQVRCLQCLAYGVPRAGSKPLPEGWLARLAERF